MIALDHATTYVVYLLHFFPPNGRTKHYAGITRDGRLKERLAEHQALKGSRLTRRALLAGCKLYVARTWIVTDPRDERAFKKNHNFARLCPLCNPGIADPGKIDHPPLLPVAQPTQRFLDFE